MKKYSNYKDPQVFGIGLIPENWHVKKIKHNTYVKARIGWKGLRSDEFMDQGYSYLVTGTDFHNGKILWNECFQIDEDRYNEDKFIQLKSDDILITKDGTIGKIVIVEQLNSPATLNSGIFVVRPLNEDYNIRFLYYILISNVFTDFIEYYSFGSTIKHLYQNVFEEFQFPAPSLFEQSSIIDFLNIKTVEINKIIGKKVKLFLLLEEEHKAIINQAVTKGLNSNVKLKDSGVEWLGEIPKHWELRKLSRSFEQISSGTTPKSDREEYYENADINWILTGDLNDSFITIANKKITQQAFDNHSVLKLFPIDTLLIAMYGATIGRVGILKIEACTNQACCALTKSKYFINEFLLYWFISYKEVIVSLSFGGGQPNISQEIIKSLKVVCPPISEQEEILSYIHNTNERIDSIKTKIKKEISLLKEYKQSLIFEAVTGKIDLRETKNV